MTLIVALRAGPRIGVACADREVTYTMHDIERRMRYKARKIVQLGDSSFVGYAGDLGNAERIVYRTKHDVEGSLDFGEIVAKLTANYDALRHQVVSGHMEQAFGVRWQDYLSGSLSPELRQSVKNALEEESQKHRVFDVDLLVCGIGEDGIGERTDFSIMAYKSPGERDYSKYSDSIGISDMADISTTEFLESLNPRVQDIGLAKCAHAVVEAKVKAERRNPGIGRGTQLVWINEEGKYQETSERETGLLSNLVRAREDMLDGVSDDLVDSAFANIVGAPETKEERARATDKAFADVMNAVSPERLYRYLFLTNG